MKCVLLSQKADRVHNVAALVEDELVGQHEERPVGLLVHADGQVPPVLRYCQFQSLEHVCELFEESVVKRKVFDYDADVIFNFLVQLNIPHESFDFDDELVQSLVTFANPLTPF